MRMYTGYRDDGEYTKLTQTELDTLAVARGRGERWLLLSARLRRLGHLRGQSGLDLAIQERHLRQAHERDDGDGNGDDSQRVRRRPVVVVGRGSVR